MVAVPLLYGSFVLAVGALVCAWLVTGLAFAKGAIGIMLYLAVLGAGLTILVFLGKAFFSPPKMQGDFKPIPLAAHPSLAALIRRVCLATGAPEPAEVAVDMSLNGAASLIHPLWGLFNNRYRLTLGLPLAAISDQQHMAHVIAHEVGHFSQSGAMRIRQLIHWAEYYLRQLIDGRDRWDIWLASQRDSVYLLRVFSWVALGGIWLSRRILGLLLRGILLVNARMSREMEFHADLYAIRAAGSVAFAASVETFAAGAAAMAQAMRIGLRAEENKTYPDNFAELVRLCYNALTAEQRRELARQSRYTIGLGYDSHPDDTDRLARADVENDPGILAETGDAAALFTDFDALCRTESIRFYGVQPETLAAAASLMENEQLRDEQDAGRIEFFGAVYEGPVWLRLGDAGDASDEEWPELIRRASECRTATLDSLQGIVAAYSKWVTDTVILRRIEAGLPVNWMQLEIEPCDGEEGRRRIYAREREYTEIVGAFHAAALPIRRRLLTAYAHRSVLPLEKQQLFEQLLTGVRAMEAMDDATTRIAIDLAVLGDLSPAIKDKLSNFDFMQTIQSEFDGAVRNAAVLDTGLQAIPHPLQSSGDLLDFARPERMDPEGGVYAFLHIYGNAIGRLRDLRLRMMGLLAELAVAVESLAIPVPEEESQLH